MAERSGSETTMFSQWVIPAAAALIATVFGMSMVRPRIESRRPDAQPASEAHSAKANFVNARLWEDPLSAIYRGIEKEKGGSPDFQPIFRSKADFFTSPSKKVLLLLAYANNDGTSRTTEPRRRLRFALLSALGTAEYVPEDAERLYFIQYQATNQEPSFWHWLAPAATTTQPSIRDSVLLPYEWYAPREGTNTHYSRICVMWISEDIYPADKLESVKQTIEITLKSIQSVLPAQAEINVPDIKLMGGMSSFRLRQLNNAIKRKPKQLLDRTEKTQDVELIVTHSTVPSVRQDIQKADWNTVIAGTPNAIQYQLRPPTFFIGTDQVIAELIIDELRRRGIQPGMPNNDIALITEWDAAFGRDMLNHFQHALSGSEEGTDPKKLNLHQFAYLSSIDGRRPIRQEVKERTSADKEKVTIRAPGDKELPHSELAEGDAQYDYVMRLVERMRAMGRPFKAIGLLGDDPYDKLILLRALRQHFPEAVFFTNDMDARLLQAGDYADVRNLLIASHYGLELTDSLQGRVPPFRHGYDAADYLGCLWAVHYKHDELQRTKQIISRVDSNPSDLRRNLRFLGRVYEVGNGTICDFANVSPEPDVRPSGRRMQISGWLSENAVVIMLAFGAMLLPFAILFRYFKDSFSNRWFLITGMATVASLLFLLLFAYLSHADPNGEPIALTAGISIWPSELIRWLAAVVCWWVMVLAHRRLTTRLDPEKIKRDFGLESPVMDKTLTKPFDMWWWNPKEDAAAKEVWTECLFHRQPRRAVSRCIVMVAISLVFLYFVLYRLFGSPPTPARGALAIAIDSLVEFILFCSLLTLLFYLIDASLLCNKFLACLKQRELQLPEEALRIEQKRRGFGFGIPYQDDHILALPYLLALRLTDYISRDVAGLIVWPFAAIFLHFVSMNPIFDRWFWNVPLTILMTVASVATIICAITLQRSAMRVRRNAEEKLTELIAKHLGDDSRRPREELLGIREEVQSYKTGAFAGMFSITGNPIYKALLMLLLGSGAKNMDWLVTLLAW